MVINTIARFSFAFMIHPIFIRAQSPIQSVAFPKKQSRAADSHPAESATRLSSLMVNRGPVALRPHLSMGLPFRSRSLSLLRYQEKCINPITFYTPFVGLSIPRPKYFSPLHLCSSCVLYAIQKGSVVLLRSLCEATRQRCTNNWSLHFSSAPAPLPLFASLLLCSLNPP
jgi:hypothetical protein